MSDSMRQLLDQFHSVIRENVDYDYVMKQDELVRAFFRQTQSNPKAMLIRQRFWDLLEQIHDQKQSNLDVSHKLRSLNYLLYRFEIKDRIVDVSVNSGRDGKAYLLFKTIRSDAEPGAEIATDTEEVEYEDADFYTTFIQPIVKNRQWHRFIEHLKSGDVNRVQEFLSKLGIRMKVIKIETVNHYNHITVAVPKDNVDETKKKKVKAKGYYSGAWNKAEAPEHTKYDPPGTSNKGKSARKGFVG